MPHKPVPPRHELTVYWIGAMQPPRELLRELVRRLKEELKLPKGSSVLPVYLEARYDDRREIRKVLSRLKKRNTVVVVALSPRVLGYLYHRLREIGAELLHRVYVPVIEVAPQSYAGRDGFAKACFDGGCYAVALRDLLPLEKALAVLRGMEKREGRRQRARAAA